MSVQCAIQLIREYLAAYMARDDIRVLDGTIDQGRLALVGCTNADVPGPDFRFHCQRSMLIEEATFMP